jgi:modulator of FtsH protease HflK
MCAIVEKTMRIDHHAYQRATRVAAFGLLIQVVIGLTLLIFGIVSEDSAFKFSSVYVLTGVLVWLGLIVIFHQHKLERLEALEEDELAATRAGMGSIFDAAADESRVAARRLRLMHKWLMPIVSVFYALLLGGLAFSMLRFLMDIDSPGENPSVFQMTPQLGWAVAVTLAFAVVSFIFSRFVAGMAKQPVWQNLRGGAGHMVGNAVVMLAVAAGIVFRFFDKNGVMLGVGYAIPIYMGLVALEIILNFILNLYRPRVPGEVPRPAFDSKLLSLLATPDSIVRSINEAVNYQFGFDVTSSWGYQLLIRSLAGLITLGVVTLVALNTMVIVEPHQQAIRLRGGQIVGDVHGSGIMWKWPWPIETAQVYDVTRTRSLHLTAKMLRDTPVRLWTDEIDKSTDVPFEPFLVGRSNLRVEGAEASDQPSSQPAAIVPSQNDAPGAADEAGAPATEDDAGADVVSAAYSLVDAEIVLQYRIKNDKKSLLDYLNFAPDTYARRQSLTVKERAIKSLALAEVSAHLSQLPLDDVLSPGRTSLVRDLRVRIQQTLDEHKTGVEVMAVNMPMVRPSGTAAAVFEELGVSVQAARQRLAEADRNLNATFTTWLGDAKLREEVAAALDGYDRVRRESGANSQASIEQRLVVEKLLINGRGRAAQMIADAEEDRWVDLMQQRVEASRVQGEMGAYRAAPEYYRQRMLMSVYKEILPYKRKYLIGVDPARVNIDIDLKDINPLLNIGDAMLGEGESGK